MQLIFCISAVVKSQHNPFYTLTFHIRSVAVRVQQYEV